MSLNATDILLKTAVYGEKYLSKHEKMQAGHNGPYKDEETPVRNTAHWAMIFLKAYEISQEKKYFFCAKKCIYFLKKHLKKHGYFICRKKIGKDVVNGLIGQAWALEPLIKFREFEEDDLIDDLVNKLIFKHEFDEQKGLWKILSTEKRSCDYDYTFNHQLWFASVCSDIKEKEVKNNIKIFLDKISSNLHLHRNGRIGQSIYINFYETHIKNFAKSFLRKKETKYMVLKEVGYHAFNTYAFIRLFRNHPKHLFWKSDNFYKLISYMNSAEYQSEIFNSKYSFPYNPPGFEVYATNKYFDKISAIDSAFIKKIWKYQINKSWDKNDEVMSRGAYDIKTNIARAYECCECVNDQIN